MTQKILIRNALAVVTMDHARREIAGGEGGALTLAKRAGGGLDAVIELPVQA